MQIEVGKVLDVQPASSEYGAVFEYMMPYSQRREDVILLISGAVLVVELKGDGNTPLGDNEQMADYASGLYTNHALCGEEGVRVQALLVLYGMRYLERNEEWYTWTNIDKLHEEVLRFDQPEKSAPIPMAQFLYQDNHQPPPSLVQAVRAYFSKQELPRIKRIDDVTGDVLRSVISEIRDAHSFLATKTHPSNRCARRARGPEGRSVCSACVAGCGAGGRCAGGGGVRGTILN